MLVILIILAILGLAGYFVSMIACNRLNLIGNNFEVFDIKTWKKYWISRSVAVSCFVFRTDADGERYVLANKRGPGTPDFQGCWNCVCGYMDFDETGTEAAMREIEEETGLTFDESFLSLQEVITDPTENSRQNIILRYVAELTTTDVYPIDCEGGEEDEVEEVKWINVRDIDKYPWAFNHLAVIRKLC